MVSTRGSFGSAARKIGWFSGGTLTQAMRANVRQIEPVEDPAVGGTPTRSARVGYACAPMRQTPKERAATTTKSRAAKRDPAMKICVRAQPLIAVRDVR